MTQAVSSPRAMPVCGLCKFQGTPQRPLVAIDAARLRHADCQRDAETALLRDGMRDLEGDYDPALLRAHMRWSSDKAVRALAALVLWRHVDATIGEVTKALETDIGILGARCIISALGLEQDLLSAEAPEQEVAQ